MTGFSLQQLLYLNRCSQLALLCNLPLVIRARQCVGDESCLKDPQLKDLDSALGGVLLDLVQFQGFKGTAVSVRRLAAR